MKREITTDSVEQTEQVAEKIGQALHGGEVIELVSDLGGGKTTFTRGLAKGIHSPDKVASPTFTVSKLYVGKKLQIYHFDFYRLGDAGLMEHELHDVMGDPEIVVVVEWGNVVAHVLPEDRLTIRLKSTGDTERALEITCPESLQYLVEELK
jgi:tRNA threonylcarbamoyladenosine biosynthesis protein TsaE